MSSYAFFTLGTPQADVANRGHDAREELRAKQALVLRNHCRLDALVDREADVLPHFARIEAVAHQ